jgi:glycosyltransferase involved in cell wall biosynthesis
MKQELSGVTSVLIPLYNHEKFIERTLDSLLGSDCSKIELLISDDSSSDQSVKVAEQWLDRYRDKFRQTNLFTSEKNRGITASLNTLVDAATGEFITILASDDMLPKNAIDMQRNYLLGHSAVDFIFVNCAIIDKNDHVLKPYAAPPFVSKLLSIRIIALLNALFNWSVIWSRLFGRRRAFIGFGRYIEEHSVEDRWSALKIMNAHRYAYLAEIGYLYRFRGEQAHPAIHSNMARKDFHDTERRLHPEAVGLLYLLLWIRRLPVKTNRGKWPCRKITT